MSTAQHSGYTRRLGDLPWQGLSVRIWLSVHRYRCRNHECARKIFCERVPGVARVYGRYTERLDEIVSVVGYVAAGLPGARLLERLSIHASDDSIRRRVRSNDPSAQDRQPIRYLGVDDWAWRKRQSYGTILVDLERHRVADLLPDRSAESLTLWLEKHPGVEVIARDRGGLYADGRAQEREDPRRHRTLAHALRLSPGYRLQCRHLSGVPRTTGPAIPPPGRDPDSGQCILSQGRRCLGLVQIQPALAGSASVAALLAGIQHPAARKRVRPPTLDLRAKTARQGTNFTRGLPPIFSYSSRQKTPDICRPT